MAVIKKKICSRCGFVNDRKALACRGLRIDGTGVCGMHIADEPDIIQIGGHMLVEHAGEYYDEKNNCFYPQPFRVATVAPAHDSTSIQSSTIKAKGNLEGKIKICPHCKKRNPAKTTVCDCSESLAEVPATPDDREAPPPTSQPTPSLSHEQKPNEDNSYFLRIHGKDDIQLSFDGDGVAFLGRAYQTDFPWDKGYPCPSDLTARKRLSVSSKHAVLVKQSDDRFVLVVLSDKGVGIAPKNGSMEQRTVGQGECALIRLDEPFYLPRYTANNPQVTVEIFKK